MALQQASVSAPPLPGAEIVSGSNGANEWMSLIMCEAQLVARLSFGSSSFRTSTNAIRRSSACYCRMARAQFSLPFTSP